MFGNCVNFFLNKSNLNIFIYIKIFNLYHIKGKLRISFLFKNNTGVKIFFAPNLNSDNYVSSLFLMLSFMTST